MGAIPSRSSLQKSNREQIAPIALYKMGDHERFAPVTLNKRATGAILSFPRAMGEIHFFPRAMGAMGAIPSFPRGTCYFALSLSKNERFAQKTEELIQNQGWASVLFKRTQRSWVLFHSLYKNTAFFAFFFVLYKRMRRSLHSFTFFKKERVVLCVLLHSL